MMCKTQHVSTEFVVQVLLPAAILGPTLRPKIAARDIKISEMAATPLVNMRQSEGPRNFPAKLATTLSDMGIVIKEVVVNSATVNPTNMTPDEYHQHSVDNNLSTWWTMLTKEEYISLLPTTPETNRMLATIPGALRMPAFDKVLFATSPQMATATMIYHLTEFHTVSQKSTWILVAYQLDFQQGIRRNANSVTNLLARGFNNPQLQVEYSKVLKFNTFELPNKCGP